MGPVISFMVVNRTFYPTLPTLPTPKPLFQFVPRRGTNINRRFLTVNSRFSFQEPAPYPSPKIILLGVGSVGSVGCFVLPIHKGRARA